MVWEAPKRIHGRLCHSKWSFIKNPRGNGKLFTSCDVRHRRTFLSGCLAHVRKTTHISFSCSVQRIGHQICISNDLFVSPTSSSAKQMAMKHKTKGTRIGLCMSMGVCGNNWPPKWVRSGSLLPGPKMNCVGHQQVSGKRNEFMSELSKARVRCSGQIFRQTSCYGTPMARIALPSILNKSVLRLNKLVGTGSSHFAVVLIRRGNILLVFQVTKRSNM